MKKFVKYLALSLLVLMPLSAFAESWWSPNRVRVNLKIGGSSTAGEQGAITAEAKCPDSGGNCTAASLSDGTLLASMTGEDKESERATSGFSIHYIMDMNILVGIHLHSTENTSLVTQLTDWAATSAGGFATSIGTGVANAYNTALGGAGTALGVIKRKSSINFLDVGYFYDMADIVGGMSVSGGLGLPLLGASGETYIVYGATGQTLNGGVPAETITADEASAMSYFVDFGYAFGVHEALFSLRMINTSGSATVPTDKGIGNGISMLIMIGIISRFPGSLVAEALSKGMSQALLFIVEIAVLFGVVMFTVMVVKAIRRIPVQYAKQVIGGNLYRGKRQYIPVRVNSSGVMPIIFAQALMFLPAIIGLQFAENSDFFQYIATSFSNMQSWPYNLTFAFLIILFTFFYTAITINPNQMADDMKRNNGFIPGIKPGKETSDFISGVLDRVTLPGSLLLAIIAVLPAFAMIFGVSQSFSTFYGGTSLLIMVGVILDTLQQIESYLLMRSYDGMMKSGKVKGRSI